MWKGLISKAIQKVKPPPRPELDLRFHFSDLE